MNRIISKILTLLIFRWVYPGFNTASYSKKSLLAICFYQKILRINGSVPWPVHFTSKVKAAKNIIRGSKAPGFSPWCYIDGRNGITIEENVWIGPRVSIISMDHDLNNYSSYKKEQPIVIRKNSLLTTGCIILPGVELGEHTVVAAGAIVTKSFPEGNQVLAGNPARVIKKIEDYKSQD